MKRRGTTVENKETYTFEALCKGLEISMSAFSKKAGVDEGTVARIRKGNLVRQSTANKLLRAFSEVYGMTLTLDNVSGLTLQNIVTDKPTKPPASIDDSQDRIVERNPGGQAPTDIPADLPPGTIKLIDFIEEHGLLQGSVSRWMKAGIRGEKIETTKIDRTNGPGVQHFFTPTQQEKALDFLRRHGKLKTSQSEQGRQPVTEERQWWEPEQGKKESKTEEPQPEAA